MANQDLTIRTRIYARSVIRLYSTLPKTTIAQVLGKQVLRSGTSVGAHYAEAKRSKSNKDFITKIEGALQELEETLYWLALLRDENASKASVLDPIDKETNELIAIFVTIVRKVKAR